MEESTSSNEKLQAQGEELEAIKDMLKIRIDGDWDEDMIGAAFDNLEALLCGGASTEQPDSQQKPPASRHRPPASQRSAPKRRRRR